MAFKLAEAFVELQHRGYRTVIGAIDGVKSNLGSLVSYATGPLGISLAGIGAGATVAGMLKMASGAEQLEIAFGTMLGSANEAKKMIGNLTQFAAKTPFELPGVTKAAKTLMSFGHEQDQIIPLLQVLGDVSAGTGKDLSELAVIFGQISATGKLTGGDLMQLTNAGVPILKVLGDQLGKTTGEVKDMVEGGEISSGMVTKAFQSMGQEGGLFAGMMEKQSQSLGGLWSTLTDSVGQGALAIGQALVDGFDLKTVVADFTGFVEKVRGEWMPSIVESVRWVGDNMVKPFFSFFGYATDIVMAFVQDADLYWQHMVTSLGNQMNNAYQVVATAMSNSWNITKWFFTNFVDIASNVLKSIPELFMLYIEQIKNNWTSLLNFFATGKLEFDFSPMQKMATKIFDGIEMPRIEIAQQDALKGDLESIEKQIATRMLARQKKQQEEAAKNVGIQNAALKIDEATTEEKKKQTKEQEKQRGGFSDLAALADKNQERVLAGPASGTAMASQNFSTVGAVGGLANSASKSTDSNQSLKIESLTRQVTVLESLLALAQGSGLKVSMPSEGSVQLPSASVQFGGT
jgi:tape measure domain-containing protein